MGFLIQPVTLQTFFGTDRKIGSITVQTIINETTNDTLTITKQPVQQGASITDHAYKEPTAFSMSILASDNLFQSLSKIYQDFLTLQLNRNPIDVITPKRIYHNMLIAAIGQTTDKKTENILSLSLSFQEVILVTITTTQVPRNRQRLSQATAATQQVGKKSSFLYQGAQAIGVLR